MKEKVTTNKVADTPSLLSQAIIVNGFIYTSGQIHSNAEGILLEGSTEEKTHQVMKNLQSILHASGASIEISMVATKP